MHEKQSGRKIFLEATAELGDLYPESERQSLIYWLMEDLLQLTRVDIALGREAKGDADAFQRAVARLATGEPIQYILGYTWFRTLKFSVQAGVLIPRTETELAVDTALSVLPTGGSALDIGTGSGCIAVSIAKERPDASLLAWDVSPTALGMAKANANDSGVAVSFAQVDVMDDWPHAQVDVVVSNPPYVLEGEKREMHRNVLAFEPSQALFVPDEDPLRFYRRIATKAKGILSAHGHLVFEINEKKAKEMVDLLASLGYGDVKVFQDVFGKDRVVRGTLR